MTLHVYEQLTAAERQQVIDPTFIVHPEDVDTQAGLFNLQRRFRNFTPTDQWEETGLNQALELEFTTP